MRAVKDSLPAPMEKVKNQKALAWVNGTSRRASGWGGEKVARSRRSIRPLPEERVSELGKTVRWVSRNGGTF